MRNAVPTEIGTDKLKIEHGGTVIEADFRKANDGRIRNRKTLNIFLLLTDAGALLLAFSVALYLHLKIALKPTHVPLFNDYKYIWLIFLFTLAWLGAFASFKLYDNRTLLAGSGEHRRIVNAASFGALVTLAAMYLGKEESATGWILLSWLTGITFAFLARSAYRYLYYRVNTRETVRSPLLIVGSNDEAAHIAKAIEKAPFLGFSVVGAIGRKVTAGAIDVLGSIHEANRVISQYGIESAIIIPSAVGSRSVPRLLRIFDERGVDAYISPSLIDITASRVKVLPVAGVPLVNINSVDFSGIKFSIKRIFDLIVAGLLLIFISPLLAAIALAIKRNSNGPVLFRQQRIGRDGCEFEMYKFRTMVVDAEKRIAEIAHLNEADGPLFKIKMDPRITGVGAILRRFSLDELPQLFNVIKGEMSLVGPRPALPREVERYDQWELKRLKALPGMTGFWQVSGRSNTTFSEMIKMDIYYIDNWSLAFDCRVLAKTARAVLSADGAY